MKCRWIFFLAFTCCTANAQKYAIKAGRLIDGRSDKAAENATIVIDSGRMPGYFADIIAVKGNPLDDISVLEKVVFVMKGGRIYKRPQPELKP